MKCISFRDDVLPLKDKLYRLAVRITLDTAEAEDVVQETLVKAWKRCSEWENKKEVEAFCYKVCRNAAIDAAGRAGRGNIALEDAKGRAETVIHNNSEAKERLAIVRRLMDGLPEIQRSIMELRDIEGKTYQEIADILNISDSQVKVYLFRARTKIREQVRKIESYGL